MRAALAAVALLAAGACTRTAGSETSGCTKDSDCKGERICVAGACREPARAAAAAPVGAAPAPPTSTAAAAGATAATAGSQSGAENDVPCGSQLDTGCSADLFVQLLSVPASTPDTYDYPELQRLLRGKPSYHGVRVVEARRAPRKGVDLQADTMKRVVAIVRNRCQSDRLEKEAAAALKSGAATACQRLDVLREVLTVR